MGRGNREASAGLEDHIMRTLWIIALITFAAVLSAPSCASPSVPDAGANRNVVPVEPERAEAPAAPDQGCRICDYDFSGYKGELNEKEVDALLLALNDEYHAWAVYDRVNKDFNDPRPFSNIQKAEGRHIDQLKLVFQNYDLPFPENRWLGEAEGFKSLREACEAGIAGEIANRDLYTELFESTEREDIITVYKALQSASEENHLPAFERCSGKGSGRGPGSRGGNN